MFALCIRANTKGIHMATVVIIAHTEEDIDTLALQSLLAREGLSDIEVEVYQGEVSLG